MKTPPLYLIESLLAFANASSLAEAGKALGLSQPALTNHLKSLEEQFDQPLFAMEGRKKVLTDFGRQLTSFYSEKFGSIQEDLKVLVDKFQSSERVTLNIAGRAEILRLLAPETEFEGTLKFCEADGAAAIDGLLSRKYEVAISNHVSKAGDLIAKKFFADHFSVVVPSAWNIREKKFSVELVKALVDRPFLAYKSDHQELSKLLDKTKIESVPKISKVIGDWSLIAKMVNSGQGWSIVPTMYLKDHPKLISIDVPTSILPDVQFYLFYRKETAALKWFKDFVERLSFALARN